MIEKALGGVFKAVTAEATANPAFARRLEDALGKFAEDYVEKRRLESAVSNFHPFIAYRNATPEDFRKQIGKFSVAELRMVVEKHHLDPSGVLKARAPKKALVEHILTAAEKRAARDEKLFSY